MDSDELKAITQTFEEFVTAVRTSLEDGTFLGMVTMLSSQETLTTNRHSINFDGYAREIAELTRKLQLQVFEATFGTDNDN